MQSFGADGKPSSFSLPGSHSDHVSWEVTLSRLPVPDFFRLPSPPVFTGILWPTICFRLLHYSEAQEFLRSSAQGSSPYHPSLLCHRAQTRSAREAFLPVFFATRFCQQWRRKSLITEIISRKFVAFILEALWTQCHHHRAGLSSFSEHTSDRSFHTSSSRSDMKSAILWPKRKWACRLLVAPSSSPRRPIRLQSSVRFPFTTRVWSCDDYWSSSPPRVQNFFRLGSTRSIRFVLPCSVFHRGLCSNSSSLCPCSASFATSLSWWAADVPFIRQKLPCIPTEPGPPVPLHNFCSGLRRDCVGHLCTWWPNSSSMGQATLIALSCSSSFFTVFLKIHRLHLIALDRCEWQRTSPTSRAVGPSPSCNFVEHVIFGSLCTLWTFFPNDWLQTSEISLFHRTSWWFRRVGLEAFRVWPWSVARLKSMLLMTLFDALAITSILLGISVSAHAHTQLSSVFFCVVASVSSFRLTDCISTSRSERNCATLFQLET